MTGDGTTAPIIVTPSAASATELEPELARDLAALRDEPVKRRVDRFAIWQCQYGGAEMLGHIEDAVIFPAVLADEKSVDRPFVSAVFEQYCSAACQAGIDNDRARRRSVILFMSGILFFNSSGYLKARAQFPASRGCCQSRIILFFRTVFSSSHFTSTRTRVMTAAFRRRAGQLKSHSETVSIRTP
ncbi:hypothetical protein [Burkholderia sp. Ac-20344]|uniref:hypothetical protein n=1 Tax=Burkholderia sp. Ac-20344 TaxID=2703890 RepID=UPI00197B71D4|nr:hypothetical protein [Burkholderia sp. Ac-20344]MBN3835116.1 hypothetical protein [Burkholderia sp. Ac-20344]